MFKIWDLVIDTPTDDFTGNAVDIGDKGFNTNEIVIIILFVIIFIMLLIILTLINKNLDLKLKLKQLSNKDVSNN